MPAFYAGKRVGKPLMGATRTTPCSMASSYGPSTRTRSSPSISRMIRQAVAQVSGRIRHPETGAKATYADGHVGDLLTTNDVTFASRDTSTATISGNTLTWRHGGTILVTATVNGFTSAAVSISAAYAPESIKVTDIPANPSTTSPCASARARTSR